MRLTLRKHNLLVLICTSLFLGQSIAAANQTVKAGVPCSPVGKIVSVKTSSNRTDFICKQEGKKNIWRILKSESGQAPTPKPTSTLKSTPSGKSESSSSVDNFPFQNVGIDLNSDPWQWSSANALGPFQPIKIFGRVYNEKFKEVALTFMMLKPGTKVISPISGKVIDIRPQPESCDSEIYIVFDESKWLTISFDHVVAVSGLKKGNLVKAGDVIATVPKWDCKSDWGGVEFMYVQPDANTAYCPLELVSPKFAPILKTSIINVMRKWNNEVGAIPSAYQAADLERGPCEVAATSIQKSK
jgi:hypothetical protein